MSIQAIVTDIEGTTSSVDFVYQTLFPYARRHLDEFVRRHGADAPVRAQLEAVRRETARPDADLETVLEILVGWMDQDLKATPLKALQGMVWTEGYQNGQLQGHIYPDAVAALRRWHALGYRLYVYSSGSIEAQKLLFGQSQAGDLGPLFSGYFDTTTGPKKEVSSYRRISEQIGLPAGEILFLSDVVEELDAARSAGMATWGLVRRGGLLGDHPVATDFSAIQLEG